MRLPFRRRTGLQPGYRELLERLPVAVYVSSLDRTSHAVYVSPAIVDLLGYPLEQWRETPDLFERAVHPDDRERVLAAVAESKRSGSGYQEEYRMLRADGSVVWVDDTAATVADANGRPSYWQGFLVDVSDRKEAERRYRVLVEQLPLITYIDSPHTAAEPPLYLSPQIETILGWRPDEWLRTPGFFLDHVHPDDRDRVAQAHERARQTGEPLHHEYRFQARDGRTVWLEDMLTIVHDDSGEPWYSQGFAVDVTARKEAEADRERLLQRLQRQNERLRELDRLKDEFIALVSHELRTPLTSIRGYLELLGDGDAPPDEQSSFLQVIERNAERLQRLVEDLLLAAQADADSLHLAIEDIDLAKLAVDCAEASAPTASARGISLACTVVATPTVRGDEGRLGQVVDNLLSNALKFTPPGGGVHVRVSESAGAAVVEVADSGMGIPEGEQAELFGRFFRTKRAQREAVAGVGLGLSIAKALVEAHGGRIDFTSAEGEGTTFRVHLPLAASAAAEPLSGAA
ncbi:MAG TPA: PAS domain-containing sensor histidine kinase [Gaiellaceae bacterium]|nr:PAS domain-containing sensor histidine kinase [Gaiellaceae bacterium]